MCFFFFFDLRWWMRTRISFSDSAHVLVHSFFPYIVCVLMWRRLFVSLIQFGSHRLAGLVRCRKPMQTRVLYLLFLNFIIQPYDLFNEAKQINLESVHSLNTIFCVIQLLHTPISRILYFMQFLQSL